MNKNIKSTRELGRANGCKVIAYGPSGAGKTRLCASAPNPLIISAEKGLMSLRDYNLPAWPIDKMADLAEVFTFLSKSAEARQFQTICLDSVSEIAETLYSELKKKHKDGRQLYPELQDRTAQAFRDFRDLPGRNVVMLAKMEEVSDVMGNITYRPMFPGKKLAQAAPYFVDEVFYLKVWNEGGVTYRGFQTALNETHVGKDRSGRLAFLENADPATGGGLSYVFNKMLS